MSLGGFEFVRVYLTGDLHQPQEQTIFHLLPGAHVPYVCLAQVCPGVIGQASHMRLPFLPDCWSRPETTDQDETAGLFNLPSHTPPHARSLPTS